MSQRDSEKKVNKDKKVKAKSSTAKDSTKKGKGRGIKHKNFSSYGRFINTLLKDSHPEVGVTKNGMKVLNSFVIDLMDKIATEAGHLCKYHKQATISSSHLIGAVKLVLPPEIAQHAIEEGQKAFKAYSAATKASA